MQLFAEIVLAVLVLVGLEEAKSERMPTEHVLAPQVHLLRVEDSDLAQVRTREAVARSQLPVFVVAPAIQVAQLVYDVKELLPDGQTQEHLGALLGGWLDRLDPRLPLLEHGRVRVPPIDLILVVQSSKYCGRGGDFHDPVGEVGQCPH